LITRVPLPTKTSSNAGGELAVPVANEEPEVPGALAEVHHEVARLLGGPGSGRMSGDANDMDDVGLDLHHEQDIKTLQQHGVHVHEVAR
jgi:hypothetical protein